MRLTVSSVPVVVLLLAVSAVSQSLVRQPPADTFQLRSALVGAHPRLYFTSADTADIRQRATGSQKWYYDKAKADFGHYLGQRTPDNPGTWKDYLFGFWGQFSMCMFYVVEKDTAYANCARSWALFYANRSDWLRDDLIPMDITSGMALTYDILYDHLSPADRTTLRTALKRSLDTMMTHVFVGDYYTQDFQNNHMHNRVHGIAHAAFAILGDDPSVDVQTEADLALGCFAQIVAWAPDDGSAHEGPGYWDYGYHWLTRTAELIAHTTGSDPTAGVAHFDSDHLFRLYMTAPGWASTFGIGDANEGAPSNAEAWIPSIARTQDAAADSVIRRLRIEQRGGFYQQSMWGVLWSDPSLTPESYSSLPLYRFWPDLEMFSIRSSWSDTATAFVFKCGPPGGNKMQQLRGSGWVNVAHDHPDQNHFMLASGGRMLAQDDGYPRDRKLTRSHNTIVVDTLGQTREGSAWYQPFDYSLCGHLDDVLLSGSSALAAGNASNLYTNADRFVRNVAFVEGGYVVLIDELVGAGTGSHEFDWRLHKNGTWRTGAAGEFFVDDSAGMGLQIRFLEPAPAALTGTFLPAELTAQPCLSAKTTGNTARFTSVLVPQHNGQPSLTSTMLSATGGVAVEVQGTGFTDVVVVSSDTNGVSAGTVFTTAARALVRTQAGNPSVAMMTRGGMLSVSNRPLVFSPVPANAAWRVIADGAQVEIEPAYNTAGSASTTMVFGGLTPGTQYRCTIAGYYFMTTLTADTLGTVSFDVPLTARTTVTIVDASAASPLLPRTSPAAVRVLTRGNQVAFSAADRPITAVAVHDLAGRLVWQWHPETGAATARVVWQAPHSLHGRYVARVRQGQTSAVVRFALGGGAE